jgi:hypothetical protein
MTGVNHVAIIQLSPFLSLSLCYSHYPLDGSFEAGFRRNTVGFTALSLSVYFSLSVSSSLLIVHSLRSHFRLTGGLGQAFDGIHSARKREVRETELALLAQTLND